jgi:hypothetical protein
MNMKKPSFLERLTGSAQNNNNDYDRILDDDHHFGDEEEAQDDTYENDENLARTTKTHHQVLPTRR